MSQVDRFESDVASVDSFCSHYSSAQFRSETWNDLKHQTDRMARDALRGRDVTALRQQTADTLRLLESIESYWAFPGHRACVELTRLLRQDALPVLARQCARIVRLLVTDIYRRRGVSQIEEAEFEHEDLGEEAHGQSELALESRPYFEVLVVDDLDSEEQRELRERLLQMRLPDDEFIYDVVFVSSFEDAVIAVQFNHNIQSAVIRFRFPYETTVGLPQLRHHAAALARDGVAEQAENSPGTTLAGRIAMVRPEIDLFQVTDETMGSVTARAGRFFRRVFYRQEDYFELHLSILKGVRERFDTPFFTALRSYSRKPTGVFHALPISRGKSILMSHWIQDMGRFYGKNIFLAETSSTTGGLDSLLQPTGPLKRTQEAAARAFGARQTFLVTNGTSTANKIVTQALVRPGDFVMLSHDCHKSHPYALVLAGAQPVYMDPYPLQDFSMYGGVPLAEIKRHLLELKAAGKLDRVRMLLLTNSTFDGVVYDPFKVMCEVLAIKPDMIFLWDEAWFAFACCTPTYRQRTAMDAATRLRALLRSDDYRARYTAWKQEFDKLPDDAPATWAEHELMFDPEVARVRVYATHSTHKTLTSLRQGSMIHVHDQDFEMKASDAFHEAYMTHTSTSPNYQILASLDVGRRQVELEGYELVRNSVGLAMTLRKQITDHALLSTYFTVLKAKDLIPAEFRPSGLDRFYTKESGFARMEDHWRLDEFALDPTRITLFIGRTGMDGDTFRKLLSERFDIQVNKTSRNTVLFLVNIGSTRGSVSYLLDVLTTIAEELSAKSEDLSALDRRIASDQVRALIEDLPSLPNFSRFHPAFVDDPRGDTPEGDMRRAFFLAYDESTTEFLQLDGPVSAAMASGREVVSAAFVTPYPPGFPILVPGQILTDQIVGYLRAVDVKEIHGFKAAHGLKVFRQQALDGLTCESPLS